jgi:hypothetical protein
MSYGDNPIERVAQDQLSRDTAVQALKMLVNDPALDTPLAPGVYGEWGSGKTCLMQMLMRNLWIGAGQTDRACGKPNKHHA